jgi:hypothetical protein
MATQIVIDGAKQTTTIINFVVRNTGTTNIDLGTLNAYMGDGTPLTESASGSLGPNQRSSTIPATGATACTCSSGICYVGGKIQTIRITIGTGLETSTTVNC